jgi:hypothetical protein
MRIQMVLSPKKNSKCGEFSEVCSVCCSDIALGLVGGTVSKMLMDFLDMG